MHLCCTFLCGTQPFVRRSELFFSVQTLESTRPLLSITFSPFQTPYLLPHPSHVEGTSEVRKSSEFQITGAAGCCHVLLCMKSFRLDQGQKLAIATASRALSALPYLARRIPFSTRTYHLPFALHCAIVQRNSKLGDFDAALSVGKTSRLRLLTVNLFSPRITCRALFVAQSLPNEHTTQFSCIVC